MNKKTALFFFLAILSTHLLVAQSIEKKQSDLGLAISAGKGITASASWQKLHGIGKSNRFKVGYGVRFTLVSGKNLDFETAPYKIRKVESQIDKLSFKQYQTNSLNAAIHLGYSLSPKLDVGFNIDALGVSFGAEQAATFKPLKGAESQSTAKPTGVNILLVGDNDIGSLNSEFFARYWISEKIGLRVGLNYQFVEYMAAKKLAYDNDRFRGKLAQPMVGISIKL